MVLSNSSESQQFLAEFILNQATHPSTGSQLEEGSAYTCNPLLSSIKIGVKPDQTNTT